MPAGHISTQRRRAEHQQVGRRAALDHIGGADQAAQGMAEQHHRQPELTALDHVILNVVEELGEPLDVTPGTPALAMTTTVEGQHVIAPPGQEPADMVVPPGVFADAMNDHHRGPNRGLAGAAGRSPTSLQLGQAVPRARQLLSYHEIGHPLRVSTLVHQARLLCMQPLSSPSRPFTAAAWPQYLGSMRYVGAGGVIGAAARWGILTAVGPASATLAVAGINLAGSILLGLLVGLRWTRSRRQRLTNNQFLLAGRGFCGAFTTFSTYAVEVATALDEGMLPRAASTGLGTAVVVVVGAGIGYRIGSRP